MDAGDRAELRIRRIRSAGMWTQAYLILGGFAVAPALPALVYFLWMVLRWDAWPFSQRTTTWLASYDDPVSGLSEAAFYLSWVFSIMLVPLQIVFAWIVIRTRRAAQADVPTGWPMCIALSMPFVLPVAWYFAAWVATAWFSA